MERRLLIWEDDREEHIARHNVRIEEAEEVFYGRCFERRTRNNLLLLVGQTDGGRYLAVVTAPLGDGVHALVTARDADARERRWYVQWRG